MKTSFSVASLKARRPVSLTGEAEGKGAAQPPKPQPKPGRSSSRPCPLLRRCPSLERRGALRAPADPPRGPPPPIPWAEQRARQGRP